MTTYVYEIIPQKHGEKPRHFEIQQSIKDALPKSKTYLPVEK